ncbi:transposase, partial [Paenibacillus xylanexedens]|uniref:transposase n=1 Tax=Paenibacillus xylanexedens TaxID=528191 RepID=UPI0034D96FEE
MIEPEASKHHIHIFLTIPPNLTLSPFIPYLNPNTTLIIFHPHPTFNYPYPNPKFSSKPFYLDTLPTNNKLIHQYIPNQFHQHILPQQITIPQYIHPFTPQQTNHQPNNNKYTTLLTV